MRKIIKAAVVCDKCGTELESEKYDHFCDSCKKMANKDTFDVEIYWKDESKDAEHFEFCCLECVREWLLKFPYDKEQVHFVTLPYINNVDDLYPFLNGNKGDVIKI
jgi:RNase P subunit RPR2